MALNHPDAAAEVTVMPFPSDVLSTSLSLHDTRRLPLACRLLLADGVARRVEEWCGPTPPRLCQGWAGQLSPMELRRQIGNVIAVTLPADINERLFHMIYDHPLLTMDTGHALPCLHLPDIAFLSSEIPPSPEVIFSQTGFPHSIIAAWFLAVHYPLFDEKRNLHPVWAGFYFRQLLEWHLRLAWLQEVRTEINAHKLNYPMNILDEQFPFPEIAGYQAQDILEFCFCQDGNMDFTLPPASHGQKKYLPDWFRRSLHPMSPYQRVRLEILHDRPPEVKQRFRQFPHIEQRFQLFIEQRAVLMYFAPLRPLFTAVSSRQMLNHLLSPFGVAAWLDIVPLLPPDALLSDMTG